MTFRERKTAEVVAEAYASETDSSRVVLVIDATLATREQARNLRGIDQYGTGRWHVVNTSKPNDFDGCSVATHHGSLVRA